MPYCIRADVESVWNPTAVLAAAVEEGHITRAIERGAEEMNAFLELRYHLVDLVENAWCREANATLAAYYLSLRFPTEDTPAVLFTRYSEFIDRLRDLRDGRLKIPGVVESVDTTPTVTNFTIRGGAPETRR